MVHTSSFRPELQSIRGLAAIVVVISHSMLSLKVHDEIGPWFDLFFNAHASVMLFFVLSGYVLSLSIQGKVLGFKDIVRFYIKRFFRIYPLLWFMVASIFLLYSNIEIQSSENFSSFLTKYTKLGNESALDIKVIILSFIPILFPLLPPVWSLIVEIAGSVLMPFLPRIIREGGVVKYTIMAVFVFQLIFHYYLIEISFVFYYLSFMIYFFMGSMVAVYRPLENISLNANVLIAACSLFALIFGRPIINIIDAGYLVDMHYRYTYLPTTFVEGISAAILISSVVSMKEISWLRSKFLLFLGDISYGTYLTHWFFVIIISHLISVMGFYFNPIMFIFSVLVSAVISSALLYKFLELPFIGIGRKLSDRIK